MMLDDHLAAKMSHWLDLAIENERTRARQLDVEDMVLRKTAAQLERVNQASEDLVKRRMAEEFANEQR